MSDQGMYAEPDIFTAEDRASLRAMNPGRGERTRTIEQVVDVHDGTIVASYEKREMFTFEAPGIGTWRFDVRSIKDAIVRGNLLAHMMRLPDVPEHFYSHVLTNNGVESKRLSKLTTADLERPGIMVLWPDGHSTLIDGNHRLCGRYLAGARDFRFLIVDVRDCVPFMCRPGDEEKLFAHEREPGVELLHSEIRIED